jgi:hypothetical protein
MSRYPMFDRRALDTRPLAERVHDLAIDSFLPLNAAPTMLDSEPLAIVGQRIAEARRAGRAVVLAMGAHVLRAGVQRQLIDLMERGFVSHLAFNGAAVIHDYEFALIGKSTESVARYITEGQFGLWNEVDAINRIVADGAARGMGLGECVGAAISERELPHADLSLFAAAWRLGIPATVHVGIGYDIVYEHGGCDGAAWGATSYRDFLIFAKSLETLEGGAFLSHGSAVMGPEIYLKALAMVRNVAKRRGEEIRRFTTLVTDLIPIAGNPRSQAPKTDPQYYYRPYKTILVRTVADGGESFYVSADHREVIPTLRHRILES